MFLPFTCLLHCYWGIFTKFEEKGRNIISAYLAKINHNLKNNLNYWHNFRNIGALLVAYYATFSSTISKPKGKGNSEEGGGEGGKAVQKRGNFRGVGVAFRGVFPEALGNIGELLKSNSCSVEQAVSYFRRSFIYGRLNVFWNNTNFSTEAHVPFSSPEPVVSWPLVGYKLSEWLWGPECTRTNSSVWPVPYACA